MSYRTRPDIYRKVDRLRDTQRQTLSRKPLKYEVRRLVSFLQSNNLQVELLSDNDLIVMYRHKEIMYLDFSSQFSRQYIGVYYDYQVASSMQLSGRYNSKYMNMLVLEYRSLSDVANDILTYMTNTYKSYRVIRDKF